MASLGVAGLAGRPESARQSAGRAGVSRLAGGTPAPTTPTARKSLAHAWNRVSGRGRGGLGGVQLKNNYGIAA